MKRASYGDDYCDDFDQSVNDHDYEEDGDEEDYSLRIYSEYIKGVNV